MVTHDVTTMYHIVTFFPKAISQEIKYLHDPGVTVYLFEILISVWVKNLNQGYLFWNLLGWLC